MVVSAVVGTAVVGSVVGGIEQSNAAGKAASAQRDAAAQANATQQGFFNQTQAELQPFVDTGTQASSKIGQLEGLNGASPSDIMATLQGLPGYQFTNQQGLKSTQNQATARGLGLSGAALKGAATYSTGLANSTYGNYLSGLQATTNTGESAAAGVGQAATATGNEIGNNDIGAGKATAAGDLLQGQANASIANSLGGAAGSAYGLGGLGGSNALIASSLLQNSQNQNGIYGSVNGQNGVSGGPGTLNPDGSISGGYINFGG